jgi:hypothetical protein
MLAGRPRLSYLPEGEPPYGDPPFQCLGYRRFSCSLNRQPQNWNLIAMRNRIVLSFQLSRQDCRGPKDRRSPRGRPANHFDSLLN